MDKLIPKRKAKQMAAIIEPKRIGEFMRAIHTYQGTFVVCCAELFLFAIGSLSPIMPLLVKTPVECPKKQACPSGK